MATRFEEEGHARYLTFGCYRRKHLFNHEALADLFVQSLVEWRDSNSIALWSFVVMPNHVHMLVHPKEADLGKCLADLKQTVGFHAQRWLKQHLPVTYTEVAVRDHGRTIHRFWQEGGGYDRNIFSENAVIRGIDYIHNNPVRAGMVKLPEEYKWSSTRFWLNNEPDPVAIDVPEWWRDG